MNPGRERFILLVTVLYALIGLTWIFFSDQMLLYITDAQSLVRLSTTKGILYVIVTTGALYVALRAVPAHRTRQGTDKLLPDHQSLKQRICTRSPAYLFAALVSLATMVLSVVLTASAGHQPMLAALFLPVTLSAVIGGTGPGLLALSLCASYQMHNILLGSAASGLSSSLESTNLGFLVLSGTLVSLLSGRLRNSLKQAETLNNQLQAILSGTTDAIFIKDTNGKYLLVNRAAATYMGRTHAEILDQDDPSLLGQEAGGRIQATDQSIMASGQTQTVEEHFTRTNGERLEFLSTKGPIRNAAGEVIGLFGISHNITERNRARSELIESEQRFRSLFENMNAGFVLFEVMTDAQGQPENLRILAANRGFEAATGRPLATVIGQTLTTVLPGIEQDKADWIGVYSQVALTGQSRHFEQTSELLDVVYSVSAYQAGPGLCGVTFQDITDRKRAEEALRTREMQLRLFIGHAPAALAMFDENMRYITASSRWRQDYGLGDVPLSGRSHYEVFPQIGPDWKEIHRRGLAGETMRSDSERFTRQDGTNIWLAWEVRPWYLPDRKVGGVLIFTEDVTLRKHLEEQMAAYQKTLEAQVAARTQDLQATHRLLEETQFAMNHAGIGIQWVDYTSGRILYVNQGLADMLGYTLDELLTLTVTDINHGYTAEGHAGQRERIRQNGRMQFETLRQHKNGSDIPVEVLAYYQEGSQEHPAHVIAFVTDITERKKAEAALIAATRAAEAANQAKSAFLASMSHEIRTPMNGVLGMANLLRRTRLDSRQQGFVENIETSGHHLLAIINDILDFSKIEAGKVQLTERNFVLGDLIQDVWTILGDRASAKGLAQHSECTRPELQLHGDNTRLSQALVNYLGNAVKFTERGSITLRCLIMEETAVDYLMRFEVSDTGIGLNAEQQGRIFNAFEQADNTISRKYSGTGLGLVITRHIAQLMGGEAGVHSQPGAGSTFWLTARLGKPQRTAADQKAGAQPNPEAALRALPRLRHILVVEDEPINQTLIQYMLEDLGLQVDMANNGREALSLFRKDRHDLVLMDMQMPEMNGLDATRALRTQPGGAEIPIIAMTANAFADDQARCFAAGMDDFIPKPFELEQMYTKLLHWLNRKPQKLQP